MATTPEEIMTMGELVAHLKISNSMPYKQATEEKLPGTKIGRRWRFHKDAIGVWLKNYSEHLGKGRS